MIEITINNNATPAIQKLIDSLEGEKLEKLNRQAGAAALSIIKLYHKAFNEQGKWNGGRYLGEHPNGSGPFGASVTAAWHLASVDTKGVVIGNNLSSYAFKVNGGTIVPKRAKFLTIPLIQEARGIRARVYSQNGHDLFRPRGKGGTFKNVLAEKVKGTGTIKDSTIRAVYALVRSVTMKPVDGAMPPADLIRDAFYNRYRKSIEEIIETL